jgi:hypothetical protein
MIFRKHKTVIHLALPTFVGSDNFFFQEMDHYGLLKNTFQLASYSTVKSSEVMLFNLLTATSERYPPYAAISALGSGLEGDHHWLRVDPVELQVDAGNIYLMGRDHLLLKESESLQLLSTLNALLNEEGLRIIPGAVDEWYLRLPIAAPITTYPLSEVVGKDIRPFLPGGDQQKSWRKLLTELQMLLFSHPVNNHRLAMNQPLINSVWFWGEGQITRPYPLKDYQVIFSDHTFVKGMHRLSTQKVPLINSHEVALNHCCFDEPGEYLITLDPLQQGMERVATLLGEWVTRIKKCTLHRLFLYLGNGSIYRWQASWSKHFINSLRRA